MKKTVDLYEQQISWDENTVFQIQVGKGKGSYKTKYTLVGKFLPAVMYYRCINIGNGFKKRFVVDGKVIVRQFS